MPYEYGNEEFLGDYLVLRHEMWNQAYVDDSRVRDIEFSYEMIHFLVEYIPNQHPSSQFPHLTPFIQRNARIARRVGCYKPPLLTELHTLTGAGEVAYLIAEYLHQQLKEFYRRRAAYGDSVITYNTVHEAIGMSEIVVKGSVSLKAIKILKLLYKLEHEPDESEIAALALSLRGNPATMFRVHDGRNYLKGSYMNTYKYMRFHIENLLKFGLAEVVDLPKDPDVHGRGRAPVGVIITPAGSRFLDLFRMKFTGRPDTREILKRRPELQM